MKTTLSRKKEDVEILNMLSKGNLLSARNYLVISGKILSDEDLESISVRYLTIEYNSVLYLIKSKQGVVDFIIYKHKTIDSKTYT